MKDLDLNKDSTSWEGHFLDISGNNLRSKLLLSNLFVPPRTSNDFTEFENIFFAILNKLADKYKHMIIVGNTGVDALKFKNKS